LPRQCQIFNVIYWVSVIAWFVVSG